MKQMKMRMTAKKKQNSKATSASVRRNKSFNLLPKLLVIVVLLGVSILSLSIIKTINPFYTFSPFIKDITIGEPVISSWNYGGVDASGNLRFYHNTNGFQTVTIPPGSQNFAADGTYVVLLDHTPVSLKFETRNQFIMQKAIQAGVVLFFIFGGIVVLLGITRKPKRGSGFRPRNKRH